MCSLGSSCLVKNLVNTVDVTCSVHSSRESQREHSSITGSTFWKRAGLPSDGMTTYGDPPDKAAPSLQMYFTEATWKRLSDDVLVGLNLERMSLFPSPSAPGGLSQTTCRASHKSSLVPPSFGDKHDDKSGVLFAALMIQDDVPKCHRKHFLSR